MRAVEVPHGPIGILGENRDGGILPAVGIFAAKVLLKRIRTGAEQTNIAPAALACMMRNAFGSATATTAKSMFCAICCATPLAPSIHIVHMGHGLTCFLPHIR
jgi:hypothetical protein